MKEQLKQSKKSYAKKKSAKKKSVVKRSPGRPKKKRSQSVAIKKSVAPKRKEKRVILDVNLSALEARLVEMYNQGWPVLDLQIVLRRKVAGGRIVQEVVAGNPVLWEEARATAI